MFLAGTDVAANFKRLRDKREGGGDVVAEAAARVLREAEEEDQQRKRLKVGEGVSDAGGKDLGLQEQIARIHQKARG